VVFPVLPKDTAALISTASEYGLDMPIVNAAREINRYQRSRVIEKLLTELKILKGNTIAMMGLAFRPNTDDLRDAPSVEFARQLTERGARVSSHGPVAMTRARQESGNSGVASCDDPEQIAKGAGAVIVFTEWPQYRDPPWESLALIMRNPLVLDWRHFLDRLRLSAHWLPLHRFNRLTGFGPLEGGTDSTDSHSMDLSPKVETNGQDDTKRLASHQQPSARSPA
jgi:UDPglucose 6-dehydrogenase